MITFAINDMTCGHCVRAITGAVQAIDPRASVQADLATHRVQIETSLADPGALRQAIERAGYTPVPLAGETVLLRQEGPRSGGCCCR